MRLQSTNRCRLSSFAEKATSKGGEIPDGVLWDREVETKSTSKTQHRNIATSQHRNIKRFLFVAYYVTFLFTLYIIYNIYYI